MTYVSGQGMLLVRMRHTLRMGCDLTAEEVKEIDQLIYELSAERDALLADVERLTRENSRLIREQDERIKSHQRERENHLGAYHSARGRADALLSENKRLRRVANAARKVWEEACEDVTMTEADAELGAALKDLDVGKP